MNNYYMLFRPTFNLCKGTLLLALILLNFRLFAFNGGTYTINPSLPASSSNYLSFQALINDLRNISRGDGGAANYLVGGAGVQGAITINVASGSAPFNQQISIPSILGMSATRTITINGNGNTLSFTPTSTAAGAVLDLNGADYFIFNNLIIVNNATFGYCAWLRSGADFNVFRNCQFRCPFMTGTPTGTAYIWISNGTTSPFSYSNAANSNIFENNILRTSNSNGPYYGIVMVGPTASSLVNGTSGNRFANNIIQNWRYCGFFISYTSNTEFIGNTVHNTDFTITSFKYGLYLNYSTGVFDRNRVYNIDGSNVSTNSIYPVYYYNFNNATRNSVISNNTVHCRTTGFNYNYIYNYATFYGASLAIINNTFAHVSGTVVNNNSTTYVMYGGYWNTFRNNLLACDYQGTGTKYLYYDFSGGSVNSFTNNCFDLRSSGNTYFGYVSGQPRTTFADLQASGFNTTNINVDPLFLDENAASDLHPSSIPMCNKGAVITGNVLDQRGNTRSSQKPDIGSIEYTLDVSLTNLYLPISSNVCSGNTAFVTGTVKNNSAFPVRNIEMATLLNSRGKVVLPLNNVLLPGDTTMFKFPMPLLMSKVGSNVFQLFSNFEDDIVANDSLRRTFNVIASPGGAEITKIQNSAGIYDYQSKGYGVFPFDESFEMEMTNPRKYTMNDYGKDWTNSFELISEKGYQLPQGSITYSHINNGRVSIKVPLNYLDSTIWMRVKVIDLNTGCDTTYSRRFIVAPKGNPKYILPQIMCDGSEIYFDNLSTVSSGNLIYEWDFGDGSPVTDATSPVHEFPSHGAYTIKMRTITAPYGFIRDTVFQVIINEVPNIGFKVVNACDGKPLKMLNTTYIGSGNINYEWDFGDGVGKSNSTNPSYVYSKSGIYRITLNASSNGCTNTMQRNAYSMPKPIANFRLNKPSFCENEKVDFVNLSTIKEGVFGCIWDFSDAKQFSTEMNPQYDFVQTGFKNIQLKVVSEFGCVDSFMKTIEIKPAPLADFTAENSCNLTPSRLLNASTIPANLNATYLWKFSNGIANSILESPIVNWGISGPKSVRLKVQLNNGCSEEIVKQIKVGEEPIADFNVQDQCAGENVSFVNQTRWNQGQIQYNWEFGDGFTASVRNPLHIYNQTTSNTYTVSLIAKIEDGCSDTVVKTVTINPIPTSCNFEIKRNYANGKFNFDFMPLGDKQKIDYTWLFGDGTDATSSEDGISHAYSGINKYCVTMIAKNPTDCECRQTKCLTVTTSVEEKALLEASLDVYPNPSTGVFNLDNRTGEAIQSVVVKDAHGKVVMTFDNANASIDLQSLSNGVYFLEIGLVNQIVINKKLNVVH